MILTIDIGNSSTKLGVFDNETLVKRLIIPTIRSKTADEIYESVREELNLLLSGIIISSVVPELRASFREFGEKYFNQTPFLLKTLSISVWKLNIFRPPISALTALLRRSRRFKNTARP